MDKRKPGSKFEHKSAKPRPAPRTLGPVPNLEEHVAPDWWCGIFNHLYLQTDGDVVDDLQITRTETDLVTELLALSPEDRILDLCCGQGRHSLELARRGFRRIYGLDRSHYLIQKARESARAETLKMKFKEGDARKLPYGPDTFDVVLILGNSFGYFETVQDDLRVLKEVLRVAKPWGKLLIDIADGDFLKENFQNRSWEWINHKLFVCRERSLSLDGERLVSREVITDVRKGVIADQFYAERLYSHASLTRLLAEAGFSEVTFAGELSSDSRRAQDLGMMERRIIVTAQVRKKWAPVKQKAGGRDKHVVVVLGDPDKPDLLKPQNSFDDDDLYTIDQMKAALRELRGYRFTYLSNHDTLLRDLQRLAGRTDYVLNFCDEGLGNEARNELHIPVLLEAIGLPYSGAGPQCLAYCYDKSLVRGVAREMGIPVPEALFIRSEDSTFELPFDFPAIVKPNFGDASYGITSRSVVGSAEELIDAILAVRQHFGYDQPVIVEEFLTGPEITVGIIGTPPSSYTVLPLAEEDYSILPPDLPRVCGYEAKWCPDSPYWQLRSVAADLPADTEQAIVEWCVSLSERLDCRDYVRLDWRLDTQGNPRLLEVNPNPGWCWDGHMAKMAALMGVSYPQMLGRILRATEERVGIETEENGGERKDSSKTDERADDAEVACVPAVRSSTPAV